MSATFYKNNRKKLRQKTDALIVIAGHRAVQASGDNALPFVQDSSFFYLTGLDVPGLTLVMDDSEEYLIVPEFDEVRIAFEGKSDWTALLKQSSIASILTRDEYLQKLADTNTVATLPANDMYIEHYEMFANPSRGYLIQDFEGKEIIDLRSEIMNMRMIKQPYEIKQIERAITETAHLLEAAESARAVTRSERDIHAAVEAERIGRGLKHAYNPIIAGGSNAVTLHYTTNNQSFDPSDILLLDIGAQYNGYAADITRAVCSNPTPRQQAVHDAVIKVQNFALSLLRPGTNFKEYELAVRDFMKQQLVELQLDPEKVNTYYPHRTSHFMGLDVHDVGDYTRPMEVGMVMTVEPGIYIAEEGIGVRIEDDVLITKDGVRVLSDRLPKTINSLTI